MGANQAQQFLVPGKGGSYITQMRQIFGTAIVAYVPLIETNGAVARDAGTNGCNGAYAGGVTLANTSLLGLPAPLIVPATNGRINWYSAALNTAFSRTELTFMAWLKVRDATVWTDGQVRNVLYLAVNADNNLDIRKLNTDNSFRATYRAGAVSKNVSITFSSTAWFHMALTASVVADQVKMFINGVQVSTTQTVLGAWAAGALDAAGVTLASQGAATKHWDGWIAHATLLNRVATDTELGSV